MYQYLWSLGDGWRQRDVVVPSSFALGRSQVVVAVVVLTRFFRRFLGSSARGAARGHPVVLLHENRLAIALINCCTVAVATCKQINFRIDHHYLFIIKLSASEHARTSTSTARGDAKCAHALCMARAMAVRLARP